MFGTSVAVLIWYTVQSKVTFPCCLSWLLQCFHTEWVLPTTLGSVIHKGIYLVVSTKVGTWFSFSQFGCVYDDGIIASVALVKSLEQFKKLFLSVVLSVFILCLVLSQWYYSILVGFPGCNNCPVILFMTLSVESLHWLLLDVYSIVIFEESFACDLLDERYLGCESHLGEVLYWSEVLERIVRVSNIRVQRNLKLWN